MLWQIKFDRKWSRDSGEEDGNLKKYETEGQWSNVDHRSLELTWTPWVIPTLPLPLHILPSGVFLISSSSFSPSVLLYLSDPYPPPAPPHLTVGGFPDLLLLILPVSTTVSEWSLPSPCPSTSYRRGFSWSPPPHSLRLYYCTCVIPTLPLPLHILPSGVFVTSSSSFSPSVLLAMSLISLK